jgi:ATP-dependent Clp protease ATP-binding subunit ClpB
LRGHFRPEFLNRIDDIIIFHRLDEKQITHIVDIQLERVAKRLAQQHMTLTVDKAAKQQLARQGYDPQFGARPLKRTIQELLLDPLAQRLLAGEFKPGDTVRVTAQGDELIFEKG